MHPLLFRLGPFFISPLSFLSLISLLFMMFVFWYRCRKENISDDNIFDLEIILIFLSIIFSRLQFVIFHFQEFSPNILRVFLFLKYPGMGMGLTLLSILFILYLFSRKRKLKFLLVLDNLSISLALGYAIASLGLFMSGVGAGIASALPWASVFPGFVEKRHPLSLYESLLFIVLTFFIFGFERRFPHRQEGLLSFIFVWFFGLVLFIIEFLRVDSVYLIFGFRVGHILGLLFAIAGIILLYKKGFFTLICSVRILNFPKTKITDIFTRFRRK